MIVIVVWPQIFCGNEKSGSHYKPGSAGLDLNFCDQIKPPEHICEKAASTNDLSKMYSSSTSVWSHVNGFFRILKNIVNFGNQFGVLY